MRCLSVLTTAILLLSGILAQIDESNIEDGVYLLGSLSQVAVFMTSLQDLTQNPMRLGNVTSERWLEEEYIPIPEHAWEITKSPYYPEQGDYQLRYIRTQGQFQMNNVDFELPPGSSFPVYHFWRVIDVGSGVLQLRSVLQFDWDGVGDNQCLKHNGNGTAVTFEECVTDDWTQHWFLIDPPTRADNQP